VEERIEEMPKRLHRPLAEGVESVEDFRLRFLPQGGRYPGERSGKKLTGENRRRQVFTPETMLNIAQPLGYRKKCG